MITTWLYVSGLQKDITEKDLEKYFEKFGIVIKIHIKNNGTVAIIKFSDYDSVDKIVCKL